MTDVQLDRAAIAAAVRVERLALADLAAGLDEEQLATPSLCTAWTVRDVLAHLTTTTRLSIPLLAGAVVRARGSFDRMEVDLAARRATRFTTAELVAQLRASAESERRFPGSRPVDPLMDLVVHTQDVVRPLGLDHESPPGARTASLAHLVTSTLMGGPRRIAGLRLVSTDSGWTYGDGAVVEGRDSDLLLVVAGRPAGLAGLRGPGVPTLAERVGPAAG
ncbi:maleylpyruvate isomerase family mycothiol-dependent enzyme [Nocardioides dongxiaopingii]|uniref:maleylpyruvate isomerase family mycothiol-dependent enzyme n=1 Tax=Nocardioides dongxiaopingii TaxID=2576036 RepID=UPI0010C76522|nr:maleylpyruvate isomerase family mycothiol-dependent enzyme [Nocardioides dongxiaopingii]